MEKFEKNSYLQRKANGNDKLCKYNSVCIFIKVLGIFKGGD
jgi:hypothetical protein